MKKGIVFFLFLLFVGGCFLERPKIESPDFRFVENSVQTNITEEITAVYNQIKDSVVTIKAFDLNYSNPQKGSGFVFFEEEENAYVITNNHVIEGRTQNIEIVFENRRRTTAELVYRSPKEDLAILKIDSSDNYSLVQFADISEASKGEVVFAVGSQLNLEFANTITRGVLSSFNIHQKQNNHNLFLIKTDVPLNPGNSGGPLFNLDGKVLGVNTMRLVSLVDEDIQFISFSIPADFVQHFIDEVFENGSFERPELGVNFSEMDSIFRMSLNRRESIGINEEIDFGVLIRLQTEGVFFNSGLTQGRIIKSIDGQEVISKNDLYKKLIMSRGKTALIESVNFQNEDLTIHEVEIN